MRKHMLIGGITLSVLAVGVACAWWWHEQRIATAPQSRELHTFLHINCKNHNHGPAWHKNHGRTLGAKSDD